MGILGFTPRQKRFSERDAKQAYNGKSYNDFINELENSQQERIKRIKLFWDFYEGSQWSGGSPDADLYAYGEQRPTINYTRTITDVRTQFLMKNGFDITIPEDSSEAGSEPNTRQFIKDLLDKQWKLNKKPTWALNCRQTGGVTGDVYVRVSWEEPGKFIPGYAKAEIFPSNWVFPQYHSIHKDRLIKVVIAFPFTEEVGESQVERLYQEVWTKDTHTIMIDGKVTESQENKLGVIPVVHIKNIPNANSNFGISDIAPLANIQRLFNEKVADISDVIEYHGSPQTYIIGAKADKLRRGPDEVWSISDKDVKIGNLELSGDLRASLEFLERLRQYMLDVASTPEQAINPTTNVSNTPGVALHMTYLPLIEVRKVMIATYGEGIRQICSLMLLLNSIMDPDFGAEFNAIEGFEKYIVDVSFGEALPRDESLRLANDQQRLDMGIVSREQVLVEQGYGAKDAARTIVAADADSTKRAELLAKSKATETGGTFGKSRKPDPVVQGDKVSANAGK